MNIPFGTVSINDVTKNLIAQCLENNRISSGKLVRKFEDSFAKTIGVKHAVAVSSGTDADTLALAVLYDLGANRNDEVVVPALSFVSTGNAVLHAGFTPVFVDVDKDTMNIDTQQIESVITKRTRAILPVHLMGKPADLDKINKIAQKYGLHVIEDAAEAYGASYKGKPIGGHGNLVAFSLYVAHMITTGEGGIVVTDNDSYAKILRSLRAHGRACKCKECVSNITSGYCEKRFGDKDKGDIRFLFERIGYSSKMNELEAAVGIGTLVNYDDILLKRRNNLLEMIHRFQEFTEFFWTFTEEDHELIGPHAFPFIVKDNTSFTRNQLMINLEHNGIDARTLFSSIPTQCAGYEFLGHSLGDFPNAENIGKNGIHIGLHQDIGSKEIDWFMDCLKRFIDNSWRNNEKL